MIVRSSNLATRHFYLKNSALSATSPICPSHPSTFSRFSLRFRRLSPNVFLRWTVWFLKSVLAISRNRSRCSFHLANMMEFRSDCITDRSSQLFLENLTPTSDLHQKTPRPNPTQPIGTGFICKFDIVNYCRPFSNSLFSHARSYPRCVFSSSRRQPRSSELSRLAAQHCGTHKQSHLKCGSIELTKNREMICL